MDSTTGCHQVDFSKFHFQLGSICTRINSNFVFSLHRHDHYSETVLGDCHPVQLRVLGENPARDISQLATASSKWDCSAFNILIQTLCPHQLSPYQHSPCQRLTSPTRPSPFARATSMTLESTSGEEKTKFLHSLKIYFASRAVFNNFESTYNSTQSLDSSLLRQDHFITLAGLIQVYKSCTMITLGSTWLTFWTIFQSPSNYWAEVFIKNVQEWSKYVNQNIFFLHQPLIGNKC